ncbi:hypothetical protein [Paenarthrobacter nitroguajacolicus]|uniref:hypothetical protein n=1 Tax=Paenarthrobacter nitroguajacolicus TaxID=211146 RepID=UPI003AF36BB6
MVKTPRHFRPRRSPPTRRAVLLTTAVAAVAGLSTRQVPNQPEVLFTALPDRPGGSLPADTSPPDDLPAAAPGPAAQTVPVTPPGP